MRVPPQVSLILFAFLCVYGQPGLRNSAPQPATPPKLNFEVASVRLSDSAARGGGLRSTPGRLNATNMTLINYVVSAYEIRTYQLEGLPAWAKNTRYDVIAKIDDTEEHGDKPAEQRKIVMAHLQSLLEERFQLKYHREKRMQPVFNLVVSKGGFKLKPADPNAAPPAPPPGMLTVGARGPGASMSVTFNNGRIVGNYRNYGMTQLAAILTGQVNRQVIDLTDIKGVYNFSLEMSMDGGGLAVALPVAGGSSQPAQIPETGPSVFTSIQDLGLKLEAAKAETDMFIVDRIERPVEN